MKVKGLTLPQGLRYGRTHVMLCYSACSVFGRQALLHAPPYARQTAATTQRHERTTAANYGKWAEPRTTHTASVVLLPVAGSARGKGRSAASITRMQHVALEPRTAYFGAPYEVAPIAVPPSVDPSA